MNDSALHHAVIFYPEVAEAICYALWKGKSTLIKFSITFQGHLRVFHSLHTLFNAFLGLKLLDFQVIRIPQSYSLRIRSMNLHTHSPPVDSNPDFSSCEVTEHRIIVPRHIKMSKFIVFVLYSHVQYIHHIVLLNVHT